MAERSGSELHGVQIVRALAVIAVVCHHVLRKTELVPGRFSPDWLTLAGSAGVDVFFVLSGYIMVHAAFRDGGGTPAPGSFLFRRVVRIYPLYWLCCAAFIALRWAGASSGVPLSWHETVSALGLVPAGRPILYVAWTLACEMVFYLVFGASLIFGSRRAAIVATTLTISLMVAARTVLGPGVMPGFVGNPLALEFCFGFGLAWLHASHAAPWRNRVIWRVIAVAAMAAAPLAVSNATSAYLDAPIRTIVWGIPAAIIVGSFLASGPPARWPGRLLVRIGDASYSIYLTHSFVVMAYAKLLSSAEIAALPQIAIAPFVVAASIAAGLAVNRYAERPLLALLTLNPPRRQPLAAMLGA